MKRKMHTMSNEPLLPRPHQRWAHFRFSVIGPLLAAPPPRGQLQRQLQALADQEWSHPIQRQPVKFGASTIESWYYRALHEKHDPVGALQRRIRSDQGQHPALGSPLRQVLRTQYGQHPSWSYQLQVDNLAVEVERQPALGPMPSYSVVLRFMKAQGLLKHHRRGPVHSPGAQQAQIRFQQREVRSYESEYVNALWHLDFHHGSLRVLRPDGSWAYPLLLSQLDDCSRLCCHAQWYWAEGAEELCHGLGQAFQKRQLPRALMTDNGSAMMARETRGGLQRLGILHETTLPYSPYQNGKKEYFWNQIEGRLLPMLEGVADLDLRQLNEATLAFVEVEYNRKLHSELKCSPLEKFLQVKDVGRPCPSSQQLQWAFMAEVGRTQRRSDGTLSLESRRYEVPSRYGHLDSLRVRYAAWDLSQVYLCDPTTGAVLCRIFPLDKHKNAQGRRALREGPQGPDAQAAAPVPAPGLAPLMQKILHQYATTGLPPAYLPKDEVATPKTP